MADYKTYFDSFWKQDGEVEFFDLESERRKKLVLLGYDVLSLLAEKGLTAVDALDTLDLARLTVEKLLKKSKAGIPLYAPKSP
jgi:hypothetical protein